MIASALEKIDMVEADVAMLAAPGHVPPHLVIPFDFRRDLNEAENAWDMLDDMNERPDIFYSPELGGHWVATRATIIEEVFRRHELFSSETVSIPPSMAGGKAIVNNEDPPDHGRLRSLLANTMFSPRALAGVEEQARAISRALIDGFVDAGRCEFMNDFASPMPVAVFMQMFGMERELRLAFVPWVEQAFRAVDRVTLLEAYGNIVGLLNDWIDEQLATPDLPREGHMLTSMLAARIDGRGLTKEEMMGLSMLLVSAALDTTTSQMTHQMRFLAEHPEHCRTLVERPELIPDAVEAMLRRFGMVNTGRIVREDITFHGVDMKAGEMVLCSTAIAGLDRKTYPEPREVSFVNGKTRHWAFGSGVHTCPGAYLARMELRVLLEEALPRMPNLRLANGASAKMASGVTLSPIALPLEWDAG